MTRPHPATVVAVVLITVGVVGAVATLGRVGVSLHVGGWPSWVLPFVIGFLVRGRTSHKVGRAHQRIAHAVAVWQGHPR